MISYKNILIPTIGLLFLAGAGCTTTTVGGSSFIKDGSFTPPTTGPVTIVKDKIILAADTGANGLRVPTKDYTEKRTKRSFGEYFEDYFVGYHAGEDIEWSDSSNYINISMIGSGIVKLITPTPSHRGVVVVEHRIAGERYQIIYGGLDLKSLKVSVGDIVLENQIIGRLGGSKYYTLENERKRLHLGIYKGITPKVTTYVQDPEDLNDWINPYVFFNTFGSLFAPERRISPDKELGGNVFRLSFLITGDTELEYVPQTQAWNVFNLNGGGTARQRSKYFITFDETGNLDIQEETFIYDETSVLIDDLGEEYPFTVGDNYPAKKFDIERTDTLDTTLYPTWMNERHSVVKFKNNDSAKRVYSIAYIPDEKYWIFDEFLETIRIQ